MKSQLKKIIPCIMAGVAGISYGKPIDNSNIETNDSSKVTEEESVALNKSDSDNDDENENLVIEKISIKEFEKRRAERKKEDSKKDKDKDKNQNQTVIVKQEKENYRDENIAANPSKNFENVSSKDSTTSNYNYKRNNIRKKSQNSYSEDPDLIQINVEYKSGFAKKHRAEETPLKNQTVVMPTYHAPADGDQYWESVAKNGAGKIPYAIINPNDGPDTQVNDNFTKQIKKNNEAGIASVGYVKTTGFTRNLNDVYHDIDKYVEFYGSNNISGIFFDEALNGNNQNEVNYMLNLYKYVKTKYPSMTVIGNPGAQINDAIAPYADIWLTNETSANDYINNFANRTSEFETNPENANKIYHIIHSATPEQYEEIIKLSRERNAGLVYITTAATPNAYDDLPTYFEDLMMTVNNFTPKNGSLFSPENQSAGKVTVEMPRSKVDLDLARSARNTTLKNLEKTKDGQYKLDIQYLDNNGDRYKDKKSNVKYNSVSDGVLINGSKDFGKFTLGTTFGYDTSNVYYKEKFEDIKEKIKSYQLGLSGKYDFNDNIDLIGNLLYSTNKHRFETSKTLGAISDAEFKSKILDFSTKLGYKFLFDNGYIKPYVDLGVTRVKEGDIDKLNFLGTSTTLPNGIIGIYGETSLGKVDLFGNVEYESRFSKKSYHREREHLTRYELAPLSYSRGGVNAEAGLKYNVTNNFGVKLSYELQDSKNSAVKLGFNAAF